MLRLLALGAIVCTQTVSALTISVYTSRAAWVTAVGGVYTEEDFSDNTLVAGLSFTTTAFGQISGGKFHDVMDEGLNTTWTFGRPIKAFGGYWDLAGPGGQGIGLTLLAGTQVVTPEISRASAGGFFGIVADGYFTPLVVTAGTQANGVETHTLDNLVFSSGVPDGGASAALLGAGLIAIAAYGRRRKLS